MISDKNLHDRVAVITGASRGLGKAIAGAFAQEGARLLLVARDKDALAKTSKELLAAGANAVHSLRADVSRIEDVEKVRRSCDALFPRVDILVNNAALQGPIGPAHTVDWVSWVHVIEVNLLGAVAMCRAFVPALSGQRYGKIINLSGGGAAGPRPRFSAYASSKAALVRFTETLAEELRGTGVDVNALAPGAMNTRLLDEVLDAGPEAVGLETYSQALEQREKGGTPLEEGARLAVFLASAASDGITGKLISAVWDEWESFPMHREELTSTDVYTLRRIVPADRNLSW